MEEDGGVLRSDKRGVEEMLEEVRTRGEGDQNGAWHPWGRVAYQGDDLDERGWMGRGGVGEGFGYLMYEIYDSSVVLIPSTYHPCTPDELRSGVNRWLLPD